MKINQINFSYVVLEDRLLFRVNTTDKTECRMWLTRAMSIRLSELLNQTVKINLQQMQPDLAQPAIQAMEEFQREAVISRADYQTSFTSEGATFPLGEQPLLVAAIILDNSTAVPALAFQLVGGQRLNLAIDYKLGMAVGKLLADVLQRTSDWGLELAQNPPTAGATLMH